MKKLILVLSGVAYLLSTNTFAASNWVEKPLQVQNAEPEPLGERTLPVQEVKYKNHSNSTNSVSDKTTSFNIAYSGAKLGSNDMGGDEKFNGVELGFTTLIDKWAVGFGYTYLNSSDWDASQIHSKLGYKIFDQNNTYGLASLGIGYTWASAKDFDVKLEYFTIPVELEVGHYLQSNFAVYGAVGYEWLSNTSAEACYGAFCASDSSSELDIDGVTYKVGIRYNF
ncbi:hypothetical protein [Acinetobacter junii]|uniref:hypothetical protein n=1 Tax=Acinetobacter junii TaxID=40215 RepID=UPI001901F0F8|nr:hypothetical protein [Acinetobacter junii]MBJ8440022.1 hypothetical protein [Acinetobacter junii]